ncbi:MAG: cation transporter [Patescibacteria group bacterium]
MTTNIKITNITCNACVKLSLSALQGLPGVSSAVVDKNGGAAIESKSEIAWDKIKSALAAVGKNAALV